MEKSIENSMSKTMDCFVCGGSMRPFFIKKRGLSEEQFDKCNNCGLVINRTLYNASAEEWKKINYHFHSGYQGTNENSIDPKWVERLGIQAEILAELFYNNVFSKENKVIDYGSGDGKLSQYVDIIYKRISGEDLDHKLIGNYERYMNFSNDAECYSEKDITPRSFEVVISCSVIEHLVGMNEVDRFFSLVKDEGTICLHTLICEEVPYDPDWFYLAPEGHCTIWTNAAMNVLYKKYKFTGCAYNLEAQMWFFFKNRNRYLKLRELKNIFWGTWYFSDDFIDYWKQAPYRSSN